MKRDIKIDSIDPYNVNSNEYLLKSAEIEEIAHAIKSIQAKTRKCLSCSVQFKSDWAGHRICDICKKSITYQIGLEGMT